MARHSRNTKRRFNQSRRPRRSNGFPVVKSLLAGVTVIGLAGGLSYFAIKDASYVTADAQGCYPGSSAHTVAIVDASEPRFDEAQTRDLLTAFRRLYNTGLNFNERLSILTTEEGQIGSVSSPVLTFCRTAKTQQELENVGAKSATQAFVIKEASRFSETIYVPALEKLFDPNPDANRRQKRESPILEQVQSAARMAGFGPELGERHLVLVSDLLQSTEEAQFCYRKGDLPRFEKFKTSAYFERIKPASLNGVRVTVYMLIRGGYGSAPLAYCSEDELRVFWSDYFEDAGASSIDIIRLRSGRQSVAVGSGE